MKFPNLNLEDLKNFFFTSIDLIVKPLDALKFNQEKDTLISNYNVSDFTFWFWSTMLSIAVTLVTTSLLKHQTNSSTLYVAFLLFMYSFVRMLFVAFLYYISLLIIHKFGYISNIYFKEIFGSFLFATGLVTLILSVIMIPIMSKTNLTDIYMLNKNISGTIEKGIQLKIYFITIIVGFLSIIYFVLYSVSVIRNEEKIKIFFTIIILTVAYAATRFIVLRINDEIRFFISRVIKIE